MVPAGLPGFRPEYFYVLENGTAWNGNKDTQIVRIEFTGAAK